MRSEQNIRKFNEKWNLNGMLLKHVLFNWMHIKSDKNLREREWSRSEENLNFMMTKLLAEWATGWMEMRRKTLYVGHEYKFWMIQSRKCEETIQIIKTTDLQTLCK